MGLTEEQRAERQHYIGGTDAAAVLGVSRYKTPLGLWAEKTGAVASKDRNGELPVKIGNKLEDVVAELFTEETGLKVRRVRDVQRHPKYDFIRAQIDRRVVGDDAILECKTASAFKVGEWDGEDVPTEYIIQVLHQLMVTGASYGYLACLIGGNVKFVVKKIERDEQMIAELLEKELAFWEKFVKPKVMPSVAAADDSTLLALYPNAREQEDPITLDEESDAMIARIKEIGSEKSGEIGKLIEEKKELENAIKLKLGESSLAVAGNWKITWKNQSSNRLDIGRLAAEKPEVWAQYAITGTTRVLRISENKKKEAAK